MKTKLITILFVLFVNSVFSQLKVVSSGNVGIATLSPSQKIDINGNGIFSGVASKLYFGTALNKYVGYPSSFPNDFSLICTSNTWLRIGSTGGIAFWGKAGADNASNNYNMFLNTSGLGIGTLSQAYGTVALYVAGDIRYTGGLYQGSDKRYKKEILNIEDPLKLILKMSGKTYKYNTDEFKNLNFDNSRSYGFIAQEIKEILPELVREDLNGYLAINYTSIIPILVEAIKEQDKKIAVLENLIKEKSHDNFISKMNQGEDENLSKVLEAKLYQNNPNPFKEITYISYYIPENVQKAEIFIFDMQGALIKTFSINEKGENKIMISSSSELKSGVYLYSLIIDGKEIDMKRMILTN